MHDFAGIIEVFIWAVFVLGWAMGLGTAFFYRRVKSLFTE